MGDNQRPARRHRAVFAREARGGPRRLVAIAPFVAMAASRGVRRVSQPWRRRRDETLRSRRRLGDGRPS